MSETGEELAQRYREELTRKYREAVASHLGGEQLEAVGPFWRAGWLTDGDEPGPLSIRGALDARKVARGQRLPPKFLLAVTMKRVHLFSYSVEFGDLVGTPTVGEEVAVFARGDLRFFRWKRSMLLGLVWTMLLNGRREVVTLRITRGEQTEDVGIDVARFDANPLATEVYAALSGVVDAGEGREP